MTEHRHDHREEAAPHWPERSRDRGVSPSPTKLEPNPDEENHPQWDGLPPCDYGGGPGKPCPRLAGWHYGFGHARRFLWKASVEGIDRLEHHIGVALSELVEEQQETEKRMNARHEKTGTRDVVLGEAGRAPRTVDRGPTRGPWPPSQL